MTIWDYLDRRNERRMNAPKSPRRLTFRDWLAIFLINAFIAILFYMLGRGIPKENEQLIVYMIGQLSGFTGTAVALYFTANRHDEQRSDDVSKVADAAKDIASAARTAAESAPSGTPADPVHVVEQPK